MARHPRHYLYPLNPKSKHQYQLQDARNNFHPTSVEGFLDCHSDGSAAEWSIHKCLSTVEPGDFIWVHFADPIKAIMAVGKVRERPHWRKDWNLSAIWIDWDWKLTKRLQRNPIPYDSHKQRAQAALTEANPKTMAVIHRWMQSGSSTRLPPQARDVDFKTVEVRQRQGQSPFRQNLMVAYDSKCAVTGCGVREVLQAAHIKPVNDGGKHALANGLLLRADIHNLFDLGLLTVDRNYVIHLSEHLRSVPVYKQLHKKKLVVPKIEAERPSSRLLQQHHLRHTKPKS